MNPMSDFQKAVEIVHDALRGLQENGVELRASSSSLENLAAIPPLIIESVPIAAPPPVAAREVPMPVPVAPPRPANPDGRSNTERLAEIRGPILACTKCPHLVASRTQVVFGVGNPDAELMFVGEAPGEEEDLRGEPFVGKAGELLTKIIVAMSFRREDIYIANVLKCRPDMPAGESGNRKPRTDEMQTCLPYLREQIEIIRPRAIVALGATAMLGLTGDASPMGKLRGRWHEFGGIPLMATYHPAYLLRNQSLTEKRKVWEDMLLVLERLGKPITEKQRGFFLSRT